MGERLNGIQEVRGSIPLASMPGSSCSAGRIAEHGWIGGLRE